MKVLDRIDNINKGIELLVNNNPDIITVVSIGSFSQNSIDEFSDIDLYIFTNNPKKYLDDQNDLWMDSLGKIISRRVFKDYSEGVDKSKIVLENGLMYDLTFVNPNRVKLIDYYLKLRSTGLVRLIPKSLKNVAESNILKFHETIKRGYRLHVDKMNLGSLLEKVIIFASKANLNQKLDEKLFLSHYMFFWQSCYTAAVKLIRKDFYFTILTYDHYMKRELIRMIEWETIINKKSTDVFYDSLKIYSWSGEETQCDLYKTLLADNIENMQNALINTAEMYQKFSATVAEEYKFSINNEFENFVIAFINNIAVPKSRNQ